MKAKNTNNELHDKLWSHFNQLLALADAVIITDQQHHICMVNEAYERITGYKSDVILGKKAGILKTNLTPPATYIQMKAALNQIKPWSGVFTNHTLSGELWHSSITITPYNVDNQIYFVGIFRSLEELERGFYLDENRVSQIQGSLLKVLAISCEIRDPGIESHLLRVQQLTEQLILRHNERTGKSLSSHYMSQVINASILHDIGKSAIPEGILYKPGTLAPYERTIIEMHTHIGVDILKKIYGELDDELFESEYSVARNIILHHHEKWNGEGYPSKLKGNEIPLEARIVSVVDVYDALTTKRPYKEKWTHEAALDLLRRERGGQFDPEIIDSFSLLFACDHEE